MNVAVIGTGYWGKNHVRNYSELRANGEVEEVTICDIDEKKVKELGEKHGINYTTDMNEILEDDSIEAVTLATPSDTHYELGKKIMNAGKNVLIEKPLALRTEKAEELTELANEKGLVLQVGMIFRYHPAVVELKQRIKNGEFGRIFHITSDRLSFRVPRESMGVLHALAIHEVDIFKYLLEEEPSEINCINRANVREEIEDTSFLTIGFPSGTICHSIESWMFPVYDKKRELILVGREKSAVIDYLQPNQITIYDRKISSKNNLNVVDNGSSKTKVKDKEPLREEIRDFLKCAREKKKPKADGKVGSEAVRIIEKAMKSSQEKKTITL